MMNNHRYIIISPVKDEGRFIETTLKSVVAQTIKPILWVIVDDGSGDSTPEVIERFTEKYPWIKLERLRRDHARKPGPAVVHAFNAGLLLVDHLAFDFIVKLDGDLALPPAYFEELLKKFDEDGSLGIASGVYFEQKSGCWKEVRMPDYHAAGASKVIGARCFAQIGGFVASRGWDTVDEIRAQLHGWKTAHFREIRFEHLKPEGVGIGPLRTNIMHGEIFYLTGGGGLFLVAKVLHRALHGRPPLLSGAALLMGYLKMLLRRRKRLVNEAEARFYRALLNSRISDLLGNLVRRTVFLPATRSNL
jgi:poly-beta-1,6-N-acetyl-D-glucosamine synthase